jgi:hypothetical protein
MHIYVAASVLVFKESSFWRGMPHGHTKSLRESEREREREREAIRRSRLTPIRMELGWTTQSIFPSLRNTSEESAIKRP